MEAFSANHGISKRNPLVFWAKTSQICVETGKALWYIDFYLVRIGLVPLDDEALRKVKKMKRLLTAIAAAVLTATACAAPANDNFANATPISGVEGSITGTTAGATLEPGELNGEMDGMPVKTVWFKWG